MSKIKKDPIKKNCKQCGNEFDAVRSDVLFCKHDCAVQYGRDHKYDNGIEGIDYIICLECGRRTARIYGKHLADYHNGMTSTDYLILHPNTQLKTEADMKSTSKSSGLHMKQEKYKKIVSNAMIGEKNPNHKNNTTEEQRKKISPFSKEFYKDRSGVDDTIAESMVHVFAKDAIKHRVGSTSLQYYLDKCDGNKELAESMLKERQTTFTKEIQIEKYGEVEGLRIWADRQIKWKAKVYNKDTCISGGKSNIATTLFNKLCILYSSESILYDKSEKFIHDGFRAFKYDFTIKNKIIEFNGTFWHCKPELYNASYYHKIKKKTAQEIWDYDKYKNDLAVKHGYTVLIVWEDDYRKDQDSVIKKCIDFIDA